MELVLRKGSHFRRPYQISLLIGAWTSPLRYRIRKPYFLKLSYGIQWGYRFFGLRLGRRAK